MPGPVPWSHEPNQGFLRSVAALGRAAAAFDEQDEVARLRAMLARRRSRHPGRDAALTSPDQVARLRCERLNAAARLAVLGSIPAARAAFSESTDSE